MEKVECYKTSDGKVFEDLSNAESHQYEIDFDIEYEKDEILGNTAGSRVDLYDIKEWLVAHKQTVLNFLKR